MIIILSFMVLVRQDSGEDDSTVPFGKSVIDVHSLFTLGGELLSWFPSILVASGMP